MDEETHKNTPGRVIINGESFAFQGLLQAIDDAF
jgi:hypothetical protein